jgi:hypothetical protein
LQEGRALLDTDPAAASVAIGEGLALWRGQPYEDFFYERFAESDISRLEELRFEAVELRVDADLRLGLATERVGELEGLARQHPLRERLTSVLIVALYRSGPVAPAPAVEVGTICGRARGSRMPAVGADEDGVEDDRGQRVVYHVDRLRMAVCVAGIGRDIFRSSEDPRGNVS